MVRKHWVAICLFRLSNESLISPMYVEDNIKCVALLRLVHLPDLTNIHLHFHLEGAMTRTRCPICLRTWVRLTLTRVFHHPAQLTSRFGQIPNQPRQNRAHSGTLRIQVNPTQSTSRWDTLYFRAALGDHSQLVNLVWQCIAFPR